MCNCFGGLTTGWCFSDGYRDRSPANKHCRGVYGFSIGRHHGNGVVGITDAFVHLPSHSLTHSLTLTLSLSHSLTHSLYLSVYHLQIDSILGATLQATYEDARQKRVYNEPRPGRKRIQGVALLTNHQVNLVSVVLTSCLVVGVGSWFGLL